MLDGRAVVAVLLALGYSYSGYTKLGSPSWDDGTAPCTCSRTRWPRLRPLAWSAMVLVHLGLLVLVDVADLTSGMLVAHLYAANPAWWARRADVAAVRPRVSSATAV